MARRGVSFGGTPGTNVNVVSATKITVTSPAHLPGMVDITVTTTNGTSPTSLADKFTFGTPGPLNTTKRYVYGDQPDQWFARVDTVVTWMLPDHLGSVRDLMNASGSIIDHIDYDAYGKPTPFCPGLLRSERPGQDFTLQVVFEGRPASWSKRRNGHASLQALP